MQAKNGQSVRIKPAIGLLQQAIQRYNRAYDTHGDVREKEKRLVK